jgi:putative flavoprotein involved in K+ transport
MLEHTDVLVIGAGQAGLSISYYLTQQGRQHIVLEKASMLVPAWRGRWDSFTLVTPNWSVKLPDFPYQGDDPDGFMGRDAVVEHLEQFAASFDPPVRFGVRVTSVEQNPAGDGYLVHTDSGDFEADDVVVAAGNFQKGHIPAFASDLAEEIVQLHTSDYRNPEALPDGAVLVVGSGQSGAQIAEELYQSGRKVYLCVGNATRGPRRYRGKDMGWWLNEMGEFDQTVDTLPSPKARFGASSHVTGKNGGYTLNLHQFARDGVILLGHIEGARGSTITLAPDLMENLANADRAAAEVKQRVDEYIEKHGLDAPEPEAESEPQDGYDAEIIRELDLNAEGIKIVIWATGFSFDFSWVKLPVFDEYGYPIQQRGVTDYPGLYFLGLTWLYKMKSGLLSGVGEDAAHIAADIAARVRTAQPQQTAPATVSSSVNQD